MSCFDRISENDIEQLGQVVYVRPPTLTWDEKLHRLECVGCTNALAAGKADYVRYHGWLLCSDEILCRRCVHLCMPEHLKWIEEDHLDTHADKQRRCWINGTLRDVVYYVTCRECKSTQAVFEGISATALGWLFDEKINAFYCGLCADVLLTR